MLKVYKEPEPQKMTKFQIVEKFLNRKKEELKKVFPDYTFTIGKLGARMINNVQHSPIWGSLFITDKQNVSLGRLLYANCKFSHCKIYGQYLWRNKKTRQELYDYKFWEHLEKYLGIKIY